LITPGLKELNAKFEATLETLTQPASLNSCDIYVPTFKRGDTNPLITSKLSSRKEGLDCVVGRDFCTASDKQCLAPLPTTGLHTHRLNTVTSLYPPSTYNLAQNELRASTWVTLNLSLAYV
jgi:hypothetical protein